MTENVPAVRGPVGTGLVLHGLLERRADRLASALEGTGISSERFIEGVVQAVAKSPNLLKCTQESVLMACLEAAQIGLEPTGLLNQAWLVPYKTEARLMIGYGGLITLLDRSRSYDFIEANIVYQNDLFEWSKGTDPNITHVPAPASERGHFGHVNGGGYWVAWKKGSTRPQFDVMSWDELEKRRKVSKRAEENMWKAWPEEMYRKTILRWGMKSMPLTPIIQRAMAYEQATMEMPDSPATTETRAKHDRRAGLLDAIANGSPRDATEGGSDPETVSEGQTESGSPGEAVSSLPAGCTCEVGPIDDRIVDETCPVHRGK